MSSGTRFAGSSESVRDELDRILRSPAFEASARNRQFLTFVVEETLAGRSDRIKAYSVATQVFGRGDDFDPLQDSIVRIEAARLRRSLEHFYMKEESHGLRITIPKGTYVPDFESPGDGEAENASEAAARSQAIHELGPRVLVQRFQRDGDLPQFERIGRKLTRQVIAALTRFTDLFVYGFDTADLLDDGEARAMEMTLAVDYRLSGTVTVSDTAIYVEFLLRNAAGRYIWAHEEKRTLDGGFGPAALIDLCSDVAGHVARLLAQRDGILDSRAREAAGEAARNFAGYQKLLDFQDYWRTLDPKKYEPLRRDLEKTIVGDPKFAAAFACLSMLYSNAARYGYDLGAEHLRPLERALGLARQAIQLAPGSSRAYHARAIAEWFSGMTTESMASIRTAQSLNPNDPELLAELGFRLAMRMEWDAAVPLIEEAYERNPLQTGAYRMGLFFYHFSEGRYEKALQEVRAIGAPGIAHIYTAQAAALSEMGRLEDARDCLTIADRISPKLRSSFEADLVSRQIHPDLIEHITRALVRIDPRWGPSAGLRRHRGEKNPG